LSSVKPEDAVAEWMDLGEKEKGVLNDWVNTFPLYIPVVWENLSNSYCSTPFSQSGITSSGKSSSKRSIWDGPLQVEDEYQ